MTETSNLVVIPAPIHGENIPRMMLRRLAGIPLLARIIRSASSSVQTNDDILVLTNDDEVVLLAERMGCSVDGQRDKQAQISDYPWSQVYEAIVRHERQSVKTYKTVTLLKPESPLLQKADFMQAVKILACTHADSVVAVKSTPEQRNGAVNGSLNDNHDQTMRQARNAFTISKRQIVSIDRLIGQKVEYITIPENRALEIRTQHDWWICEKLLAQKHIVFVVAGYGAIGMGHIYRGLLLAYELIDHKITFICTRESELAASQLAAQRFSTHVQKSDDLAEEVLDFQPDLVINDFLDTDANYILRLKNSGVHVLNIEDMGSGAIEADLVINALYDQHTPWSNHRIGPNYFCLRDEFLQVPPRRFYEKVERVLITFGGTDDADLTLRILNLVYPIAEQRDICLSVVTGPGYLYANRLKRKIKALQTNIIKMTNGTKRMSEYMARADVAFSSAGRTVFELVSMQVPAIILAANEREELHTFASPENGLVYLGRHDRVTDEAIVEAFLNLLDQSMLRREMSKRMSRHDLRGGKKRVIDEIRSLLFLPVEQEELLCHA